MIYNGETKELKYEKLAKSFKQKQTKLLTTMLVFAPSFIWKKSQATWEI